MNENLNLVEILRNCPKGTKLYSPLYEEVEFEGIEENDEFSLIKVRKKSFNSEYIVTFTSSGVWNEYYSNECTIFPSKDQRDWSKFKPKQSKFDPKTLNPFDKVLVRNKDYCTWVCDLFSHIITEIQYYKYRCSSNRYEYCIPYNDDTKHLVGITDEAPEFYRYWED